MVLTEETFDQAFNEFDYLMFEFYAPWSGHYKELAPKYAQAATAFKFEGIVLVKIDVTVQGNQQRIMMSKDIQLLNLVLQKILKVVELMMKLRIVFIVILILKVNDLKNLNKQMKPQLKITVQFIYLQKNKVKRIEN